MSSPFSVFRKHQKGLMAGLVIVAMVSFIVLGTADQFLRFGSDGDPQGARVIATWTGGEFTQGDLNRLQYNRVSLNAFIQGVKQMEAENRGQAQPDPFIPFNTTNEREMIRTALLVEEAKKLGVVVTDEQVMQRIKTLSQDSVTDSQLNTVLRNITSRERPVTFAQVIEAYRHELIATQAKLIYASPDRDFDGLATPAQRWDYFCRLNRRVKLEVYPFEVDKFLTDSRIPEPSDSDLRAFYEEYKDNVPSPTSPEPGFRDPEAVKLEYLKADYLKFYNDAKAKLTDEEIRQDFEKYKSAMRSNLEFAERMSSLDDLLKDDQDEEKKDDGKPAVKAPEPDPTAYEQATGRFAKRAPKATEPRFTDDEVLGRNREAIVKRLAEQRARDAMRKALDDAYMKMLRFYESAYRKWALANTPKEGAKKDAADATPPPTFDLAKLANPDAGLTYHQTTLLSFEELRRDKYLGQTFVDRRWQVSKNPQTDIEEPQIVSPGTQLPQYAFQSKTKFSPFRGEDQVTGSAEEFYRNQYVFWKTADRQENTPAFDDIKDRVKQAWKIANKTGKSARDLARDAAKRLADELNGNKTTLKDRFPDSSLVKETPEFTWYEDRLMPTGHSQLPIVRTFPMPTRLDEVEVGENRFYREVFRLSDKQAGTAMNDAGSIVYVVQVFDAAGSDRDALRQEFLRSPFSRYIPGLSQGLPDIPDEQGYAVASYYDMYRASNAWYDQLERDYEVKWQPRETE